MNIFWEVRTSLKEALILFSYSVAWMPVQILNLPKCDRVCKDGQLGGRGRKLMDHSTRSVFDFQATLQLWSLVLTSQFMDKFSLWKATCVSSGVFCSRKRIFFCDVFQTETLKLNDIFIVFQISPIQYSYWKISQWINTSQIKLAGFLSFFFLPFIHSFLWNVTSFK